MELGLKGKNVLVTGGGNNIGRAIVLAFAAEGCNIAIAELNHSAGKRVVDRGRGSGIRRFRHRGGRGRDRAGPHGDHDGRGH